MRRDSGVDGVLTIDKPEGMTSHDVVNRIRRLYGTRRVGHAGTLDPLATGVLVVCLGQATRIVEYLAASRKTYVAGVTFGVTTDTEDATGVVLSESDSSGIGRADVESILEQFRGRISQIPPMVSAVHHEGRRLYEIARKGIEVERAPREVEIYGLTLLDFEPGHHAKATLLVECSAGTYIRTLAADIGGAFAVGAMLHSLRRTQSGAVTLEQCKALEELEQFDERERMDALTSIPDALEGMQRVVLTPADSDRIARGQPVDALLENPDSHILLMNDQAQAIGIAENRDDRLHPVKVFIQPSVQTPDVELNSQRPADA